MKPIISVGVNVHNKIDNLITLISSTADVFDGTLSFLFFKVLNLEPVMYFNTLTNSYMTPKEENQCQFNYKQFEAFKFNDVIHKEIEEAIIFIRNEALSKKYIEKKGSVYFVIKDAYNAEWIMKTLYKMNRQKLKEKIERKKNEEKVSNYVRR